MYPLGQELPSLRLLTTLLGVGPEPCSAAVNQSWEFSEGCFALLAIRGEGLHSRQVAVPGAGFCVLDGVLVHESGSFVTPAIGFD